MRLLGWLALRARRSLTFGTVFALGLSVAGCGGGDDDSEAAFTATEPPDDVCTLLEQSDIRTIVPDAGEGQQDQVQQNADVWVRGCTYASDADPFQQVDLILEGAISRAGDDLIRGVASSGPADALVEHVDGVGETATYWADDDLSTLGLIAAWHSHAVGVTTYALDPAPTKDKLVPLVVKVIGKLP